MACTSQAQLHSSVSSTGVSFGNGPAPQPNVAAAAVPPARTHNQRMIGMCPPQFQRVGTDCYSLVPQRSNWLEAHFFCKDKNANLAEPTKQADRKLKTFLRLQDQLTGGEHNTIQLLYVLLNWDPSYGLTEIEPIWIGAMYDYNNKFWQWNGGRNMTYDAFTLMDPTYV